MKILVVEDQQTIAESIKAGLEHEIPGVTIDVAHNYNSGADLAFDGTYDCIVLDRMLPDGDGSDLAQELRSENINTPILMLTAKNQLGDRVSGLTAGVDDYLGKPFAFAELVARVQALTRRTQQQFTETLACDSLTVVPSTGAVTRASQDIELSSTEFRLLSFLLKNVNQVFSAEKLIEHVWKFDSDVMPNTVQVYIGYLRKKIDQAFPQEKPLIHTKRGLGYAIGIKK